MTLNNCSSNFVDEYSTNGDYSIKFTGTRWGAIDVPFSNEWSHLTFSADVLTNSPTGKFGSQIIYSDSYKSYEVSVPQNSLVKLEVSYDVDKTKTVSKIRVYFGLNSSISSEAYMDNISLIIQ